MANFRKIQVTGTSKKEAMEKISDLFVLNDEGLVKGDATQAFKTWKKSQVNGIKDSDIKLFMLDYLKNKKAITGEAYSITLESAVDNTRERPYTIEDIKNDKGARKYKTVYSWIDAETGKTIVEVDTTKKAAKDAIKNEYSKNNYRGVANLVMQKKCVEGQAVVARAKYTPSVSAKVGTFLVFGFEKD